MWLFLSTTWMTFTPWVPPDSLQCKQNLATCINLFSDWGVPLHPDKFEGPSTVMTVLGIELDSLAL